MNFVSWEGREKVEIFSQDLFYFNLKFKKKLWKKVDNEG